MDVKQDLLSQKSSMNGDMKHMQVSERLPRETGRDYALRMLRAGIISLELKPGSMVSENELAEELGLSRTPVREALIDLSKVRIVEIYPQKGSAVSLIDFRLVEEAQFMRNVLECAVAELDCECASKADIARMQESLAVQAVYARDSSNKDAFLEIDNQFHRILFETAGKPDIFTMMGSLSIHFDRVRSLTLDKVRMSNVLKDHRQIVEAISSGQKAEARDCMQKHLGRFRVLEDQVRAEYPDYFCR